MASCLGIYIGKNIIKYAKVTRESTSIKIDTYGVKVSSDLKTTINQIVTETDSTKTPISVNLNGEKYNYFSMSNLLSKKDLTRAINTEFESICYEKNENPNAVETRYALVNNSKEKNKIRVIHVSEDKIKLNQLEADFSGKRLTAATPIAFGIANIVPINSRENVAVINIEDDTSITLIEGEKVYEVRKLQTGAAPILEAITEKENSYAKAYEICKNTTIYTMENQNIQDERNEYLPDIIPTLYEIASQVKEVIYGSQIKIEKVYITGIAAVINNIDLYFNEILGDEICSILKPFFLEENAQTNIKDSIEVNSAIAIALQGLEFGLKDINFAKGSSGLNLGTSLFAGKTNKEKNKGTPKINLNLPETIIPIIKYCFSAVVALFLIYIGLSVYTASEINRKQIQLQSVIEDTEEQISKIEKDTQKLNRKSTEYSDLTQKLEDAKNSIDTKKTYKNTIPTLLSQIATIIPKGVQITSIENPSGKKVIIGAQSIKYEQLAYFKARLRQEGILEPDTVISSQAVKSGDDKLSSKPMKLEAQVVKIVIEGELP